MILSFFLVLRNQYFPRAAYMLKRLALKPLKSGRTRRGSYRGLHLDRSWALTCAPLSILRGATVAAVLEGYRALPTSSGKMGEGFRLIYHIIFGRKASDAC